MNIRELKSIRSSLMVQVAAIDKLISQSKQTEKPARKEKSVLTEKEKQEILSRRQKFRFNGKA